MSKKQRAVRRLSHRIGRSPHGTRGFSSQTTWHTGDKNRSISFLFLVFTFCYTERGKVTVNLDLSEAQQENCGSLHVHICLAWSLIGRTVPHGVFMWSGLVSRILFSEYLSINLAYLCSTLYSFFSLRCIDFHYCNKLALGLQKDDDPYELDVDHKKTLLLLLLLFLQVLFQTTSKRYSYAPHDGKGPLFLS